MTRLFLSWTSPTSGCRILLLSLFQSVVGTNAEPTTREDSKVELRILPLGASITWGMFSSSSNGYREPLLKLLRLEGWEVDMVGSQEIGDMGDNDVEATAGDTIDQVKEHSESSLRYKPNVVLINAGTNDCRLEDHIDTAGKRMRALIENLLDAEDMAETVIVISTLLPSLDTKTARHTPAVNEQYRDLVEKMREEGTSIVLADMDAPEGQPAAGWIAHPNDFADATHPNDQGYAMMAYIWHDAIRDAYNDGLIREPATMASSARSTLGCNQVIWIISLVGAITLGMLTPNA